jgi:hypothetical protein
MPRFKPLNYQQNSMGVKTGGRVNLSIIASSVYFFTYALGVKPKLLSKVRNERFWHTAHIQANSLLIKS